MERREHGWRGGWKKQTKKNAPAPSVPSRYVPSRTPSKAARTSSRRTGRWGGGGGPPGADEDDDEPAGAGGGGGGGLAAAAASARVAVVADGSSPVPPLRRAHRATASAATRLSSGSMEAGCRRAGRWGGGGPRGRMPLFVFPREKLGSARPLSFITNARAHTKKSEEKSLRKRSTHPPTCTPWPPGSRPRLPSPPLHAPRPPAGLRPWLSASILTRAPAPLQWPRRRPRPRPRPRPSSARARTTCAPCAWGPAPGE
jgi:hypothetical protein